MTTAITKRISNIIYLAVVWLGSMWVGEDNTAVLKLLKRNIHE